MKNSNFLSENEINKLPLLSVSIGSAIQHVRYDAKDQRIYMVDGDGKYTGKSAPFPQHLAQNAQAAVHAGAESAAPPAAEAETEDGTEQKPSGDGADDTPADVPPEAPPDAPPEAPSDAISDEPDEEAVPDTFPAPAEPSQRDGRHNKGTDKPFEIELGELDKPKKERPVWLLPIIGIFALLIVVGMVIYPPFHKEAKPTSPTGTTDSTIATDSTTATSPTLATEATAAPTVSMMIASRDILPGEVLTSELLQVRDISETEFAQLSSVTSLYTTDDAETLSRLVAVKYIPAGKALTFDNTGASYAAFNPWNSTNSVTITLPINLGEASIASCTWGSTVDLTLSVKSTQSTSPTAGKLPTLPAGVQQGGSEATVISTYTITGCTVIDLLDSDRNSLYTKYHILTEIPAVLQSKYISSLPQADAYIPHWITVTVTEQQYELLLQFSIDSITQITLNATGKSINTSLQNEMYTKIQIVSKIMEDIWKMKK